MKQIFRDGMEIRPFVEEDRYDVATLHREVLEEHQLLSDPGSLSADMAKISKRYDADDAGFWVLIEDNKVIGTVAIRPQGEYTAEIERFYLHSRNRSRGIGRALLKFIEEYAKKRNYHHLFVACSKKFVKAKDFFEKAGYRLVGNATGSLEDNLFEKEL